MTRKFIQGGQGRSNTGRSVMYEYNITVTFEDGYTGDMRMELPSNIKIATVLKRAQLEAEMQGQTLTSEYLEIRRGAKLPDTRTEDWRKEKK